MALPAHRCSVDKPAAVCRNEKQKSLCLFMKKNILGLFLAFLLCPRGSEAQVFRPGLLVLTKGDTLRGEVEDDAWEEAPKQVRFRAAAGAPITAYPPAALRAFRLNGGRHFRYEVVPLDRSARTLIDHLPTSAVHDSQAEALLAEVLVEGPATLLRTNANETKHYFVQAAGQPYLELSERLYLRDHDGRSVVTNGNNYRAELGPYLGDCLAAVQLLAKAPFTRAGLVAVVQAYNQNCTAAHQPGTEYVAPPHKGRALGLAIGPVLGARYSSLALRAQQTAGIEAPALNGLNEDGVVHPVGGLYLDVLHPGRRFALHAAALLSTYGRNGAPSPNAAGMPGLFDARGKLTELRFGVRFFVPVGHFGRQVVVGTGLTLPYRWGNDQVRGPQLVYGPDYSRTVQGVVVGIQTTLPDATPTGSALPYVELGVRQGRLTLAVDGRLLTKVAFAEAVTVRTLYASTGSTTLDAYRGYDYTGRRWYISTTLGFNLLRQQ